MSAPHADRDHSEQPCCGDHNHEPCRGCPDGRDATRPGMDGGMVATHRVSALEIGEQRAKGWPDFHPEDYCHRCGNPNLSWWVDSDVWDDVMRPDGPGSPWLWNEIICPQCFTELAGGGTWRLVPDAGTRWGPRPGTSRAEAAREVRASEAQVVAALDVLGCGAYQNRRGVVVCIHERHEHYGAWSDRGCPVAAAVADAVVAAGPDADEVTRLREHVASLLRGYTPTSDEAGVNPLTGDLAVDMAAYSDRLKTRAEAAEAERDRLAEVVARVEALADEWDAMRALARWPQHAAGCLLAALSGPSTAETPQNGPEPALSREQGTSGHSGEGEALRGAEEGPWRARCDVPGCGWRSWPYKARVGADTAGHEHWLSKGHGTSIGVDR